MQNRVVAADIARSHQGLHRAAARPLDVKGRVREAAAPTSNTTRSLKGSAGQKLDVQLKTLDVLSEAKETLSPADDLRPTHGLFRPPLIY